MISIEKIAKEAKVSTMTVSRSFDPRYINKVRPATREKVLKVCRKYDYMPSYAARSLASGKTFNIALVVDNDAHISLSPTFNIVMEAIIQELAKHSYGLNLIQGDETNPEKKNEEYINIARSRRADGFIFHRNMLTRSGMAELKKSNLPVAVLSMPSADIQDADISHVYAENRFATREVVAHLKSLGADKLLYVSSEYMSSCCPLRNKLYVEEAKDAGIEVENFTYNLSSSSFLWNIYDSYERTIEHFPALSKYNAFVFSNDLMAIGACRAFTQKGLIPGKDIAVIGFDNLEQSSPNFCNEPFLSTIAPQHHEMGGKIARLLIDQITGKLTAPVQAAVNSKFIIRNSTRNTKMCCQKRNECARRSWRN